MKHAPFLAGLGLVAGGLRARLRQLAPVGLLLLSSCQVLGLDAHGCTEIGCQDGVEIELRPADGIWLPGAYALTLVVDGTTHSCGLMLPADLPANGSSTQLTCASKQGFQGARLNPEVTCVELRSGDSVSQSCSPIPDQFTLSVHIDGTPERLDVILTRDGALLLSQPLAPAYVRTQPNGEGCDPTCRQASVKLALP